MNDDVERQVRRYVEALVEDSRIAVGVTAVDPPRVPRRQRLAFVAAATCLVVVAGAGLLALAGRDGGDPGLADTTVEGLQVELWVSSIAPAPDEAVTARVTYRNAGEEPIEVPGVCGTRVVLGVEGGFEPSFDSGSEAFDEALGIQAGSVGFSATPLPAPMTVDELEVMRAEGPEAWSIARHGCELTTATLAPGRSTVVTKDLVAGHVGLPPGPGVVSVVAFQDRPPLDLSVSLTIPAAPGDVVTRAEAIRRAIADPAARAVVDGHPMVDTSASVETSVPIRSGPDDPLPTLPEPPPPDTEAAWLLALEPTTQGWSIAYAREGGAFVAAVDPSGTLTVATLP